MPSSKVTHKSSIINQNQGGGNKKMGLYPSETIPASVYLARKSQKNSLKFLMKIQSTTTTTAPTAPTVNTISLVISGANGTNDYIFDANTDVGFAGGNYPAITVEQGDILEITNQNAGHPLFIKNEAGDNVTTGVTGAGAIGGATIRWDTKDAVPGTYNYYCSAHPAMSGTITVSAPTA